MLKGYFLFRKENFLCYLKDQFQYTVDLGFGTDFDMFWPDVFRDDKQLDLQSLK